jgi:hypothetical protein
MRFHRRRRQAQRVHPQTRERVNQHVLVDTVAERIDQPADRRTQWARRTKTRYRDRPREQWITIPVPSIIDTDTFQRSRHATSENPKWSPAHQPEAVRVRVSYLNVAEFQRCGALHFHCVLRLDGVSEDGELEAPAARHGHSC